MRGQADVHEVDGDYALIESAVVLGFAVLVDVRGQEGSATHASVAMSFAVLVDLVFEHDFFGNVVGNHALCGAFSRQHGEVVVGSVLVNVVLFEHVNEFGERRRDPHAFLVLYALMPLTENFLDDHSEVVLFRFVLGFVEVHEHGDERCLTVGGKQRYDLILYSLYASADLVAQTLFGDFGDFVLADFHAERFDFGCDFASDLITADLHEGREVRQRNRLSAVLVGRYLRDYLRGDIASRGKTMRALYHGAGDYRAVLQHILEVHEVAVVHMLSVVVRVVEVDYALVVRVDDLFGEKYAVGKISADFARDIVALGRVHDRILVGIFLLRFLIVALDKTEDLVVGRVRLADELTGVAVGNVRLCNFVSAVRHDLVFDDILHFFDRGRATQFFTVVYRAFHDTIDLRFGHAYVFRHRFVGFLYGNLDLVFVE